MFFVQNPNIVSVEIMYEFNFVVSNDWLLRRITSNVVFVFYIREQSSLLVWPP